MEPHTFFQKIQLPKGAQELVVGNLVSETAYLSWKNLFERDIEQFLQQLKHIGNKDVWLLVLYTRLALDQHVLYREKNISDDIYIANFQELSFWCERYYHMYGVYGLTEERWLAKLLNMQVFRLGRLQFEPIVLTEELSCSRVTYPKGSVMLNIHIPEGKDLEVADCLTSIAQAKQFFDVSFSNFICTSWLLSPVLRKWLAPDTNILRFQQLFDICQVNDTSPKGEERVFGKYSLLRNRMKSNVTTLQRLAKPYYEAGNRIGVATGVLRMQWL